MKAFLLIIILLSSTLVQAQSITTDKRKVNDSVFIDFINPTFSPIEFRIKIKDKFSSDFKIKETIVMQPSDTVKKVIAYHNKMSEDSSKTLSHYLNLKGNFGYKDGIVPNTNFEYLLPYPIGKSYRVIQGFEGSFSHNLNHSRHAIDFSLKTGDTITAARSGKVIYVKQDSNEHGPTRAFMNKANKIIIMHQDGTYGHYVHLDQYQAFVKEGMHVQAGQPIGLSGFTGFTTTPHLHFVVMKERGYSIPIKFKNLRHGVPKKNKTYKRK